MKEIPRAAAILVLASALLGAQPPPPVFRASVDAVPVDALVTRHGRPVAGLTARDFELLDNGVRQAVRYVSVETVPVDVLLVLDVSRSVAGGRLRSLIAAGHAALDALRPFDRGALLTFSNRITEQVALTSDRARIGNELDQLAGDGTTSLYDAVGAALLLGADRESRTLILLFSDGLDTSSWLAPSAVVELAARSNTVAYAVTAKSAAGLVDPTRIVNGEWALPLPAHDFLERVADATAGRVLHADDRHLPERFTEIVKEFQNRYLLMYSPTGVDARGWHEITLRVRARGAHVRARRGYWR